MTRNFLFSGFMILIIAIAAMMLPFGTPSTSSGFASLFGVKHAEAQQKRKSLLKLLFERQKKRAEKRRAKREAKRSINRNKVTNRQASRPVERSTRKKASLRNTKTSRKRSVQQNSGAAAAAAAKKPEIAVEKSEDAGKVLVVGDFMASAVARGLERQYVGLANLVVVNNTKPDSGIVRDDVIDWAAQLPSLIEEHKPVAVLVLLGMNDRQQMRLESGRVEKLGEDWTKAYRERITAITKAGLTAKVPFLWVGLPPVRSGRMNTDYLAFNEMYRSIAEANEATFVDVWDGFTNAEGKFVSAGPDINGRIVRLRGNKGITMTQAGRSKIAFFADKALRKLGIVGTPQELEFAGLGASELSGGGTPEPDYDPAKTGKTVVISLGAPALDGGTELEGGEDFLKSGDDAQSVSYSLVARGELPAPQPGRIDAGWGLPSQTPVVDTVPVAPATQSANTPAAANLPTTDLRGTVPATDAAFPTGTGSASAANPTPQATQ